jgi:hypothetical protein
MVKKNEIHLMGKEVDPKMFMEMLFFPFILLFELIYLALMCLNIFFKVVELHLAVFSKFLLIIEQEK